MVAKWGLFIHRFYLNQRFSNSVVPCHKMIDTFVLSHFMAIVFSDFFHIFLIYLETHWTVISSMIKSWLCLGQEHTLRVSDVSSKSIYPLLQCLKLIFLVLSITSFQTTLCWRSAKTTELKQVCSSGLWATYR